MVYPSNWIFHLNFQDADLVHIFRHVPQYIMLFAIVNGIVLFILISNCLSLPYGNTIDLCIHLVSCELATNHLLVQVAFVWILFGMSC